MPTITVVMPCHNRGYDLQRILEAYDAQADCAEFELIAIDDASTDSTFQVLAAYQPRCFTLHIVRHEQNKGPAAARNRGIALATAPLILFVGDDVLPAPNLIAGHLQAHRQYPDPRVAVLGQVAWADDLPQNTLMTHIDGIGAQQFSYHYLQDGYEYDFRHFYTANVSLKREFLGALEHWFDTDFPYPAFEDVELAYRLAMRGLRIIYRAGLLGRHYHYHTIWTFSTRQYRCGLMGWLLTRKHPGVVRTFGKQYARVLSLLRQPRRVLRAYSMEQVSRLETQALQLASFYEWTPHKLLDNLYLRVLDYFYYKGLIDGIFGQTVLGARLRGAHAACSLASWLSWFISEMQFPYVSSPYGNGTESRKRTATL